MKLAHAARATESVGDSPSDAYLIDGAKKVQDISLEIESRIPDSKEMYLCLNDESSNRFLFSF